MLGTLEGYRRSIEILNPENEEAGTHAQRTGFESTN